MPVTFLQEQEGEFPSIPSAPLNTALEALTAINSGNTPNVFLINPQSVGHFPAVLLYATGAPLATVQQASCFFPIILRFLADRRTS